MKEICVPISSSFVKKRLKLKGDTGSGESKIFLGSTRNEEEFDNFFNHYSNTNTYYFVKENIRDYLKYTKFEYYTQKCNSYYDIDISYYSQKCQYVDELPDSIAFKLVKFSDNSRYYVRADNDSKRVFDGILREIALPKITNLIIRKDSFSFFFYLDLNYEQISERETDHVNDYSDDLGSYLGVVNTSGFNLLLYGVPGSGKSYTIENDYCDEDTITERLVFHPDYTYSDFVGQILPAVDDNGQVRYEFTPGPFTRILKEAVNNPDQEYILIIEEINRGNAPAIFGEIFQLLDRKTEEDESGIPVGASEYGIINADIAKIVYDDLNHEVRIPSNLSIIGTMNTSDQNVFTLDTAFQRRWEMRLVENSFDDVDPSLAEAEILDTGITWRTFNTIINDKISESGSLLSSSEDKRLGVYFVKRDDIVMDDEFRQLLEDKNIDDLSMDSSKASKIKQLQINCGLRQHSKFAEKVIKYLWDDAFKFNRGELFNTTHYKTLEDIINSFMSSVGSDRFKIFNDEILGNLTSR